MTVSDSAAASDGFGIVSTPTPITPAEPTRRRHNGRVDFPGGVTVTPRGYRFLSGEHPIHVEGLGWMTVGVAQRYAASLAGAVALVRAEEAQEQAREAELRP